MAKKNFKEFVKEHKKEIVIGTVAALAGIVVCVLLKRKSGIPEIVQEMTVDSTKDHNWQLPLPKISVGNPVCFWVDRGTGYPTAIVNDLNVQHMGDLGVEVMGAFVDSGVEMEFDTPVSVIMEFMTDK